MAIIDKPSDYFNTLLYTGNGSSSHGVTGVGFTPNWTWIKERSQTESHFLFDTVRGDNKYVNSNTTDQEYTESGGMAFNSNGFTLGSWNSVNESSQTYASWNWKAGTSFTNDASATGIGSIDSTGSVSQEAGFSIVSFTGTGANATIAHGLGAIPKMMIFKTRDYATAWVVYHKSVGATKGLFLNTTGTGSTVSAYFQDTDPTSSVFSVGSDNDTNRSSSPMIAYCFAEKQGYSKFSSYVGNGNVSGVYLHLGFSASFIMFKRTDSTGAWVMKDNKRDAYNVATKYLYANANDAESTSYNVDFTANGVKLRGSDAQFNASGGTFIYMAFAENPFVTSTGVPATAR